MDTTLYSRQLILPGFGAPAQRALLSSAVAVVGAGGLGCPALTSLALAGVGRLTIIDHDAVDLSNLARQSLHDRASIGTNKALSAKAALARLAPSIAVSAVPDALTPQNALTLLADHDLVLDCTDNPAARYLINDAALALRIPLVSAAAQQYDGQLAVYNHAGGPCLRCLFPRPPAPHLAPSCSDVGVLGPVVATIGALQALEAIKLLARLPQPAHPHMLIFSALATPPFRSFKLRKRNPGCPACSSPDAPIDVASTDYVQLCGGPRPDWEALGLRVDDPTHRVDAQTLAAHRANALILDVRPPVEFGICRIEGSINIPLATLLADPRKYLDQALAGTLAVGDSSSGVSADPQSADGTPFAALGTPPHIFTVCRLGNDSQLAADALRGALHASTITTPPAHTPSASSPAPTPAHTSTAASAPTVRDLIGGLRAWARHVEPGFPVY
ncbi:hypothetical protein HDZ31DRAFT_68357 [Schizophyllum fasciatum]